MILTNVIYSLKHTMSALNRQHIYDKIIGFYDAHTDMQEAALCSGNRDAGCVLASCAARGSGSILL